MQLLISSENAEFGDWISNLNYSNNLHRSFRPRSHCILPHHSHDKGSADELTPWESEVSWVSCLFGAKVA
jgi:hypothetical protein